MRLFPARHAPTPWNRIHRIQGHTNIELDDEGIAHARGVIGPTFAGKGISLILCSTLIRGRQTAAAITPFVCSGIYIDPDLAECSFGSLEGLSRDDFNARCGPHNHADFEDPMAYDFRPFGGEDAKTVLERQMRALRHVRQRNEGASVLLIGHRRALRTLLAGLGQPDRPFESFAEQGIDLATVLK